MGRMLATSLFLCFFIGSILQGSLCSANPDYSIRTKSADTTGAGAGSYGTGTGTTGAGAGSYGTGTGTTGAGAGTTGAGAGSYGTGNVPSNGGYGTPNTGNVPSNGGYGAPNTGNVPSNGGYGTPNTGNVPSNGGYGTPNTGCGGKKGEYGSNNPDDCNPDEDSSFVPVENAQQYQENVKLDSNTAHPLLNLSADLKTVSIGSSKQNLDNNTERFDSDPCVLATTGYTNGKHYFKASGDGGFLVGFAVKSLPRKGYLVLSTDAGIFAYPRARGDTPEVVGSLLDCDQGQVLFYDASKNEVVSNLRLPNGCNEEIRPFIFIEAGELTLS